MRFSFLYSNARGARDDRTDRQNQLPLTESTQITVDTEGCSQRLGRRVIDRDVYLPRDMVLADQLRSVTLRDRHRASDRIAIAASAIWRTTGGRAVIAVAEMILVKLGGHAACRWCRIHPVIADMICTL